MKHHKTRTLGYNTACNLLKLNDTFKCSYQYILMLIERKKSFTGNA